MKIILHPEFIKHTSFQSEIEVSGSTVVGALEDLFSKFPQLLVFLTVNKGIEAEKTSIKLNDEYLFEPKELHREVSDEDVIEFGRDVPEGEGGALKIVAGAVITAVGYFVPGAQFLIPVGVGMMIGGAADLIIGPPKLPTFDSGNSTSATYTFSGIKNTTVSGTPIPIVYGRHRVGGHVLNAYVDVKGTYSYLYALLGLASGPIGGVDYRSIELNERNQNNFQDLAFYWRRGDQFNFAPPLPLLEPDIIVFNDKVLPTSHVDTWYKFVLANANGADRISFTLKHLNMWMLDEYFVGRVMIYDFSETTLLYDITFPTIRNSGDYFCNDIVATLPRVVEGNFIVKAQAWIRTTGSNDSGVSPNPPEPSLINLLELNITNYSPVDATKTTFDTQPVMYGFNRIENTASINQLIPEEDLQNPNIGAIVSTETPVDTIKLRLNAPVFYTANAQEGATVQFKIFYRPAKNAMAPWVEYDFASNKESGVEIADWDYFKTLKPSKTEVSVARTLKMLSIDYYDVKVVRVTPRHAADLSVADDIYLADIIEVSGEGLVYPWVALLGTRIRATDQISGSLPTITSIIEGTCVSLPSGYISYYDGVTERPIRYWETPWDGTMTTDSDPTNVAWTDSPIWCLWDLLTNPIHGLNEHFDIDPAKKNLILANLVAMSTYCDQYIYDDGTVATSYDSVHPVTHELPRVRYSLNLVVDQSKSAREWVNVICASMNALLFEMEGMVYLDVDQPKNITQIFNMSNIKDYTQSCASLKAIPNVFEVSFYNKDKDYDQDSFLIETPEYQAEGLTAEERKQSMSYIGVTDEKQVRNLVLRAMTVAGNSGTLASFKTGTEGLMSTVFSIIGLQHDVPQWGSGGRIESVEDYSTYWRVGLSDSFDYTVLESDGLWGQLAVSISNAGAAPVDLGVNEPTSDGTYSHLNISKTYVDEDGVTQSFTPEVGATYILGQITNTVKPFKILSLRRDSDEFTEVSVIEYLEDAYSDDITKVPSVSMPSYSQLPAVQKDSVTSVVVEETIYVDTTGNLKTGATVYYKVPTGLLWAGCQIYYGIAGNYLVTPVDKTGTVFIPEINQEGDYDFICVSLYTDGTRQTVSSALDDPSQPYASLHITPYVENTEFLKGVTGLQLVGQGNNTEFVGRDAKFTWRKPAAIDYNLNSIASDNPLGVDNSDSWLREYRITISDVDGNTLRTAKTYDEAYTYTYEQNYSDSGTLPHRTITISVVAVDRLGRVSAPSTLTVSNPAPPAVV